MPGLLSFFQRGYRIFSLRFRILFFSKLLHSSGLQLTLLFLPLFLFQIGSETQLLDFLAFSSFQKGMLVVGGYFLLQRLWVLIWSVPASQIISWLGVRNGMIVGQMLNICTLIIFTYVKHFPELLFVTALIEGLKICFFWNSYYALLSTTAVYRNMGRSVGTIEFFTKLLHVMIPTFSAFLILNFGFNSVFIIGIVLHIVSAIVLLWLEQPSQFAPVTWKEFFHWIRERDYQVLSIAHAGKYIVEALQLLWPFFILLLLGSVEKVGFLYSLVLFSSLLITYFSGWYFDHSKNRQPFNLSGAFLSLLWLGRMFISGLWSIVIVDTIEKLASSVFIPFYESIFLRRGKGNHALSYFAYREVILSLAGIGFWGVFMIYFLFFDSWRGFLIFGFLGMWASLQMKERIKR